MKRRDVIYTYKIFFLLLSVIENTSIVLVSRYWYIFHPRDVLTMHVEPLYDSAIIRVEINC